MIIMTEQFCGALRALREGRAPLKFRDVTLAPGKRIAALAGASTRLDITIAVPRSMQVLRAPAGQPTATFTDARVTHAAPGLYRVRHMLGPYARDFEIVAMPLSAFAALARWESLVNHGATMDAIVNDPRATAERIVAALEGEPSSGLPLVFGDEGIDVARFCVTEN